MKITKLNARKSHLAARKRVAAYARVSSGKDAMLQSLSAQVAYYSQKIQQNAEWCYVGVYADGRAGKKISFCNHEHRQNVAK